MEILQQIIVLLSEPPGSVIYHLITLFSLQAVFAISYSRWRRQSEDEQALHMAWASGVAFVARVILLFIWLYFGRNPESDASLLPPVEQAINTITAALIIWSISPRPTRYPRSLDILLVATITLSVVMTLFFIQEWQNLIAAGQTYYSGTTQSTIWSIFQLLILAGGLVYLLINRQTRSALPPIIAAILLLTHVINLWNSPEFIPSDTNIPYWLRFGYLIALPLWAVYAYQHALTPLLKTESSHLTLVARFGKSLNMAAEVIGNPQKQSRIVKALALSTELLQSRFSAIGLLDDLNHELVHFQSDIGVDEPTNTKKWALDLAENNTLKTALTQNQVVELSPQGLGARQLHQFYKSIQIDNGGPLLVHPLIANGLHIGLLIVGGDEEMDSWSVDNHALLAGLARYIAQTIVNSHAPRVQAPIIRPLETQTVADSIPSPLIIDQVRLGRLEKEKADLQKALQEMELGKKSAEEKALAAQKQARYLAAALRAAQQSSNPSEQENHAGGNVTPEQDTMPSPGVQEADQR